MTSFAIQRFDPASGDYEALAALWTAQYPDMPRDAEIWRGRDATPHPGIEPWARFIAEGPGGLLGMAEYTGCPTAGEPGQLQIGLAHGAGPEAPAVLGALMDTVEEACAAHKPPLLLSYARDTDAAMVDLFEQRGYVAVQQTVSSELLPPFDAAAEATEADRLLADVDCELVTAQELAAASPDWAGPYHALDVALMRDIPFVGPTHDESFEDFVERAADPERFRPEATFVARERATGTLVGLSLLLLYEQIPGYAFAGMTGVLPAWRRRGIARALKRATLGFARDHGITRIVALNEIDNPMLRLNEALGFRRLHVQMTMIKRLEGSAPA